jgi:hypothetical protein
LPGVITVIRDGNFLAVAAGRGSRRLRPALRSRQSRAGATMRSRFPT